MAAAGQDDRALEARRRQAVRDLRLLDTPTEERFDRLARALAEELGMPIAYVALLDGERQWLKCQLGEIEQEMPQDLSFCNQTLRCNAQLVVPDAARDPRFASLPLVAGRAHIRFYAGVPIRDSEGQAVGTVCVADREARQIGPAELEVLERCAQRVETEINAPPTVFISYAHADEAWKDRLVRHCEVLTRQGLLDVWVDRQIATGERWQQEIREAVERSKAAVLLISADFLTSDFILREEVPRLIRRRDSEGLRIFPVLLRPCSWSKVEWLAAMNLWPADARPIAGGTESEIEQDLSTLAEEVVDTIRERGRKLPLPRVELADSFQGLKAPTAARPSPPDPPPASPPTAESPPLPTPGGAGPSRVLLGKYQILRPLGGKGSQLFAARDTLLDRDVTLKLLPAEALAAPEARSRLEREARILAGLDNPGIATLYSLDEIKGVLALALKPLAGESLLERATGAALPIDRALTIGRKIASALGAAHRRGIVHRDLDPATIFVTADDRVQISDFGIAKEIPPGRPAPELTKVMDLGEMLEQTSPYASPEMLRHQRLDKRSDVWSFGCILWLLITGSSPFAGDTPVDTMAQIVAREPTWEALPETVPEGMREVLERCLQKDPDRRWDDMSIVETELAKLDAG